MANMLQGLKYEEADAWWSLDFFTKLADSVLVWQRWNIVDVGNIAPSANSEFVSIVIIITILSLEVESFLMCDAIPQL
jgi:hypothetical protein